MTHPRWLEDVHDPLVASSARAAMGELRRIGDYLILGFLASGGMGVVYVAWHPELDHWVALKLPNAALVEGGAQLALFRHEAQTLALLDHPNITRVYAGGVEAGQPYHAMELLNNGNLQDEEHRSRYREPAAALALVRKLAEAVCYAQQRGVLHCDIKAANILFDDALEPHVSDFGLASRVDAEGNPMGAALRGGTPGWMAPEQLPPALVAEQAEPPAPEALSQAVDAFSLGVLLHWLTRGNLPFGDDEDFAERVRTQARERPGRWTPGLNWVVRAVCFRALQSSPIARYPSAAALVDDLTRGLRGLPLRAYGTPAWGRLWLWVARHRALTLAGCLLLLLALVSANVASQALSEQERALRHDVLEANAFAAKGQAATVLYQLRDHADRLLRIAEDADVQALALTTSPLGPPGAPDPLRLDVCHGQLDLASAEALARHGAGFEMLNVLNRSGCARARLLPAPPDYPPMNFGWRDYFRGAAVLGARAEHRVYVAQVFHSSVSDEIRFSLATPLFHDGVWVGVLAAGINVGTQWALPAINGVSTDDRLTVLIGPYDGTRAAVDEPDVAYNEYAILAHPALEAGAMKLVAPDCVQKINDAFGPSAPPGSQFELPSRPPIPILDYEDPFLAGHWLGASAPVGGTGYVVLVQTREDTALRTTAVLLNRLIRAFLVLGAVALLTFISFAVWAVRHDTARG